MSLRHIYNNIMKRFLIFLVFSALVLTACSSADPAPASTAPDTAVASEEMDISTEVQAITLGKPLKILTFGDSLTEGFGVQQSEAYPAQLQTKLLENGHNVAVINAGISGETTTAGLARVDWLLQNNPDIVIVETGGNDSLRGVDLAVTQANLDEIVRKFSESGAVVIVAGMQTIQNLGPEYTAEFAALYPAVAEKHNALLIPFFLDGVAADPALNQADFIHPTAEGYAVIVDRIYPIVEQAIGQAGG